MIELKDIKERTLSNLSGLAIDPLAQRWGYANAQRYQKERDRSLAVLKGKTNYLALAQTYSNSENATVIQYRDYLLTKAIQVAVENVQLNRGALSKHAEKVWLTYSYNDLWDYLPLNSDKTYPQYWGELGSPAYYNYYQSSSLNPVELLKASCIWFWAMQGQSLNVKPNQRLSNVLEGIRYTDVFEKYFTTYQSTEDELYRLRRAGLSKPTYVKQSFLLGEYDDKYWSIVLSNANEKLKDEYRRLTKSILSIARPAGFYLIAQFFKLEAYLFVIEYLSQLSKEDHKLPLSTFLELKKDLDIKYLIAEYFALINDAEVMQQWFSNPVLYYVDLKLWLTASGQTSVPVSSPYRLSSFS